MASENKLLIPIAVLVAGALIAGAVFFKSKDPAPNTGDNGTPEEIVVAPVSAEDHVLGNPNAPIAIIEYSDIDCPFCKDFHLTMHRIVNEYGKDGQVAWVYRHFPLDQLHPEARTKAESTECAASLAGNQVFWNYLDALFERNETAADLPSIAAEVGVDQTAFSACVSEKHFAARVKADGDAAFAAGGRGTPYSVILTRDGETFPVNGAQPYEVVKQIIDTLLLDQGQ
ncbi:MAG TPA: thioredoxin domain-containing protein [Candidatus Paceibacterota bacterium]|nr:thioredoxin domain-containing protein [Candidatus Paceibacterota bacterium]